MRRKSITIAIFLGVTSLITILLVQYVWIEKTINIQKRQVELHKKEDSLQIIRFSQKVHFALSNVLDDIANTTTVKSDKYGAIRQVEQNLFYVELKSTINKTYLEEQLKREFYKINLGLDFQYSLYSSTLDTLYSSSLFHFTPDSLFVDAGFSVSSSEMKQARKGENYFTVFFPTFIIKDNYKTEDISSPWIFLILVSIMVLVYLTYSVIVIVRQKKLSDIKTDFINNMTHELKTPIATIKLSSNTLLNDDFSSDPERLKRYASIIYRENKRLENQVERVLNIAKMSKNSTQLALADFDFHDFLLDTEDTFEVKLEEIGGTLEMNLGATNFIILADSVHIKNITYNLLDNAMKYRDESRSLQLKITTKNTKKGFVIEFSDNGLGISKENSKYIFDKFYRVPTGNVHDVKGFGLGLYYVSTIVEQHGGTIQLKSQVGVGTTFILTFPIQS